MSGEPYDWLGSPSLVMAGIDQALQESIERVQALYPGRNFCVVGEWAWVEFNASLSMAEGLAKTGQTANVLVAANILFDSQERFRKGKGVRTSFLVKFDAPGYFITRNTVYVLLGTGRRVQLPFWGKYLAF